MKKIGWMIGILGMLMLAGCGKETAPGAAADGMFHSVTFGMAKTEDGIYIANASLYFFDPESEQYTILCSKPECKHESYSTCNAKISGGNSASLFYRDDYLYMLGTDPEKEELCLYQIRPDGSGYETYLIIAKASEGAVDARTVCSHDAFLYFIITETFKTKKEYHLYRLELDKNAKPEEVFSMDGGVSELISICSGQDGLWIQRQYYGENERTGSIYFLKDGKTEPELVLDQIKDCRTWGPVPSGDGFYYLSNQEIWEYQNGTKRVLTERGKPGDTQKGLLLYQDWIFDSTGKAVNIYNKEDGACISSVDHRAVGVTSQSAMTECYLAGVDGQGLYLAVIDGSHQHSLYHMKLEEALNGGKGEWKKVLENF